MHEILDFPKFQFSSDLIRGITVLFHTNYITFGNLINSTGTHLAKFLHST